MSHYYKDHIQSLARCLDAQISKKTKRDDGEQPNVFTQDELDTCNIGGGPWFEQLKGGDSHASSIK